MHQIIDQFFNSDKSLKVVLTEYKPLPDEKTSLAHWKKALNYVFSDGNHTRAEQEAFVKNALQNHKKFKDTSLEIFYLIILKDCANVINAHNEANAIYLMVLRLVDKNTPPGLAYLVEEINELKTKELLDKKITLLIKHHKKFKRVMIFNMASNLAFVGMQKELEPLTSKVKGLNQLIKNHRKEKHLKCLKLINDIETVNTNIDHDYLQKNPFHEMKTFEMESIGECISWFYPRLYRMFHNEPFDLIYDTTKSYADFAFPHMVISFKINYLIYQKKLQEVPALLSELLGIEFDRALKSIFLHYTEVRAELVFGNTQAALNLMQLYKSKGITHYLDDFFLARIELLKGDKEMARYYYARLLQSVEYFDAQNRLQFELKLALEINIADLHEIMINTLTLKHLSETPTPKPILTNKSSKGVQRLIGKSQSLKSLKNEILKYATLNTPVLITGETGVGKELIAKALHEESDRKEEPYIAINCSSVVESLLQSELFGHESGAYTSANKPHDGIFLSAGKGTVFLDEIGDISPSMQIALLRVLESGEYRPVGSSKIKKIKCRLLMATNVTLDELVSNGNFRLDLYYRLKRLDLKAQALRERKDDILMLITHFLKLGRIDGMQPVLSNALQEQLLQYQWLGNVRELRNMVEKVRVMQSEKLSYDLNDFPLITSGDLPFSNFTATVLEQTSTIPKNAPALPTTQGLKATSIIKSGRSLLRRLEQIRELFREHKILTRLELIKILDLNPSTTSFDLKKLQTEGLIIKIEPSASPRSHYFQLKD